MQETASHEDGLVSGQRLLSGSWGQIRYRKCTKPHHVCQKESVWTQEFPLEWDAPHTKTSSLLLERNVKNGHLCNATARKSNKKQKEGEKNHHQKGHLHREEKIINQTYWHDLTNKNPNQATLPNKQELIACIQGSKKAIAEHQEVKHNLVDTREQALNQQQTSRDKHRKQEWQEWEEHNTPQMPNHPRELGWIAKGRD